MKKSFKSVFIFLILTISLFSFVSSMDIDLKKNSDNEIMISKVELPAYFNFTLTNKGANDSFLFYTFFGSDFQPMNPIQINSDESKNVIVAISPREDFMQLGIVSFDMFVQSMKDESKLKFPITLNFIPLSKTLKISASSFTPDSSNAYITITNSVNFYLKDIQLNFKSDFFDKNEVLSFAPYETKTVSIPLNKESFKNLVEGVYPLKVTSKVKNEEAVFSGLLNYSQKEIIKTSQESNGLILNKKIISKSNEGNLIEDVSIVIQKNIISRLFTKFSVTPTNVDRKGLKIYYTWVKKVNPGETLTVEITTNWLIPLLIIFSVFVIFVLIKQFSLKSLELKKKVSFVKVKGGEFALKVSVFVKANQFVERVNVIDKLPPLVRLHERFGGEVPSKIDEKSGRLEWNFEKLRPGESRILSYIIYSKVGVLGKFVLPRATAVYERDGEVKDAESNQEFFIAEQGRVVESY
ncbi:hypothetical protein GYA25_01155 [Candidatus Woesearchaeota archaeon]|jgi:hypothetical protein|nr:hypothetical protein [Candidatus Woesearchaeota archaeon]